MTTAAGQTEWISWWLVGLIATGSGLGYLIATWIKIGQRLDHDPPLTAPSQVCRQRGFCLWRTVPGAETATCRQCGATHVHEPKAHDLVWLCWCGYRRARYALEYRDEATS